MDTSVIPKGQYCETFGANAKTCPYWSEIKELPEQENGFCSYLNKSDFDINEETGTLQCFPKDPQMKDFPITAHEVSWSLLWDKCKMCNTNMEDPDDIELETHEYDIPSGEYMGYGENSNPFDFNTDERIE